MDPEGEIPNGNRLLRACPVPYSSYSAARQIARPNWAIATNLDTIYKYQLTSLSVVILEA
jgi:hypothetical protein